MGSKKEWLGAILDYCKSEGGRFYGVYDLPGINYLAIVSPLDKEGIRRWGRDLLLSRTRDLELSEEEQEEVEAAIEAHLARPEEELIADVTRLVRDNLTLVARNIADEFVAPIFKSLKLEYREVLEYEKHEGDRRLLRAIIDHKRKRALFTTAFDGDDVSADESVLYDSIEDALKQREEFVIERARAKPGVRRIAQRTLDRGRLQVNQRAITRGRGLGATDAKGKRKRKPRKISLAGDVQPAIEALLRKGTPPKDITAKSITAIVLKKWKEAGKESKLDHRTVNRCLADANETAQTFAAMIAKRHKK